MQLFNHAYFIIYVIQESQSHQNLFASVVRRFCVGSASVLRQCVGYIRRTFWNQRKSEKNKPIKIDGWYVEIDAGIYNQKFIFGEKVTNCIGVAVKIKIPEPKFVA